MMGFVLESITLDGSENNGLKVLVEKAKGLGFWVEVVSRWRYLFIFQKTFSSGSGRGWLSHSK